MKKIALITLLLLFVAMTASAHNIFTEIPLNVDLGQTVVFKAFFSDPDDEIEARDMCDLSLSIRYPDQKIKDFNLKQMPTYYLGEKTFDQEGEHVFILVREPYRYRLTEIRDFGKSIVWVGGERVEHQNVNFPLEISMLASAEDLAFADQISFEVLYYQKPLPQSTMRVHKSLVPSGRVYDPDFLEVVADDSGAIFLQLDRNYNYIFEVRHQVSARDVDFDTSFFTTTVMFRTAFYLPGN